MKLLLDANISRFIVPVLSEYFGECTHVNTIGLPIPPTDTQIWNYAREHDFIIVTQDSDFLHFFRTKGAPPKVILLKTGNIDKKTCISILINAKQDIDELYQSDMGILEIVRKKYDTNTG